MMPRTKLMRATILMVFIGVCIIFSSSFAQQRRNRPEWPVRRKSVDKKVSILADTWPPNAVDGGFYEAREGDQNLTVSHIKLPNNFTIYFPHGFGPVKWTATTFEFGENCTIDLSPFADEMIQIPGQPPPMHRLGSLPSPGVSDKQNRDYGENGGGGGAGPTGEEGESGISFTLSVDTIVPSGSLWIKTDGAWGGWGGDGGRGGDGGGSRCLNGVNDGRDGGNGGNGGDAGAGGRGGHTSQVKINVTGTPPPGMIAPIACSSSCPPSQRPSSATGNTGAIVIWGAPGCGGRPGKPGLGGNGGDEGKTRNCGRFIRDRVGGAHGNSGKEAERGPMGTCITTMP